MASGTGQDGRRADSFDEGGLNWIMELGDGDAHEVFLMVLLMMLLAMCQVLELFQVMSRLILLHTTSPGVSE